MRPKGVLFDLDGTLIDSESVHLRLYHAAAAELGWEINEREYNLLLRGKTDEDIFRLIRDRTSCGTPVNVLVERKQKQYRQYLLSGGVMPITGADTFVQRVAAIGIKVGVVTSATREEAHLSLEAIGLATVVLSVVSAEDVERGKPSPEGYLLGVEKLGVDPDGCVAYEDAEPGVRAARAAGLFVVGVSRAQPSLLVQAGAALVIGDFIDHSIPEIL